MSECPACAAAESRPSYLGAGRFADFSFEYRACVACGSLFVDPMPDARLLDQMYAPGYLEEHYGGQLEGEAQSEKSEELGKELDETAARIARRKPGGRLLDVGCGAGAFLVAAAREGLRAEGIELTAATAELTARTTGLPVHAGALAQLALDGGSAFDVIHFADVLEHAPVPLDLLEAARERLAPGGVIVARGPLQNHATLFQRTLKWKRSLRARLGQVALHTEPPTHVVLFTLEGWHRLLARARLTTVEEKVYELHWPAPERRAASLVSIVKELSIGLTRSPIGRRLALGDRVVTVASPA